LLQIVSGLIDAHIADETRYPDNRLITLGDWQWMRDHWTYDAEPPPALATVTNTIRKQIHVQPHSIGRIAMAEPYIPALYVGRSDLLDQITDWANGQATQDQVMSIVGSPGVGKSYLLHRVREILSENSPQRIVLWINLSRNIAIRGSCPDLLTESGLAEWVKEAVGQAQAKCPNVHDYDGSIRPELMIAKLVQDLCEHYHGAPPTLLIVDSFEEVDEASREELEDKILFPVIDRDCTRLLISYRDDLALPGVLKWKESRFKLMVMEGPEAFSQLDTRIQNWSNLPIPVPVADSLPANLLAQLGLPAMLPPYLWNHPGINSILLGCVVTRWQLKSASLLLQAEDLKHCIGEITQSGGNILDEDYIRLLTRLAIELGDDWTSDNLREQLKTSLEDKRIDEFFRRGIVFNIEGTSRYMIADGLRELLRASQAMSRPATTA
jgi:hypothetical protein